MLPVMDLLMVQFVHFVVNVPYHLFFPFMLVVYKHVYMYSKVQAVRYIQFFFNDQEHNCTIYLSIYTYHNNAQNFECASLNFFLEV